MNAPQAREKSVPKSSNRKARRRARKKRRSGSRAPNLAERPAVSLDDRVERLLDSEQFDPAIDLLQKALSETPDCAASWRLLGQAYEGLEQRTTAYKCYKQAVCLAPDDADAWFALANVLQQANRFDASAVALERYLELCPDSSAALFMLAWAYTRQGKTGRALEACDKGLVLEPTSSQGHFVKGITHKLAGDYDPARKALQRASELDPNALKPLQELVPIADEQEQDTLLEKVKSFEARMPAHPAHRSALYFTIADIHRAKKRHDEAFTYFRKANDVVRRLHPYDAEGLRTKVDDLIAAFTPEMFERCPGSGCDSRQPVFIVGMPRSGTSLTEQILSSHSRVHGAGEHFALPEITRALSASSSGGLAYPRDIAKFPPDALATLAAQYLTAIDRERPDGVARVTDKMLFNFLHLGLVAQMFPKAAIIHCRRDPIDTCLSCYFQSFYNWETLAFTFDLTSLGLYYREYARLMEHWRKVLPTPLFELDYEQLVAAQETESRRMIEFVGLDWEDGCLNFHESERAVVTASIIQARKPIYTSATGRWRRYERHLEPLLRALGPLAAKAETAATA